MFDLLHPLELEIAAGIVGVGRADRVGDDLDTACGEHLHHERSARPRQTGDDDDFGFGRHGITGTDEGGRMKDETRLVTEVRNSSFILPPSSFQKLTFKIGLTKSAAAIEAANQ